MMMIIEPVKAKQTDLAHLTEKSTIESWTHRVASIGT